jgi:hypothetical protein
MAKEERGVYTDMEWWTKVRLEALRGNRKKRDVLRSEGIGWETLKKILAHPEPPGYRLKEPRPKPKIGAYLELLAAMEKIPRMATMVFRDIGRETIIQGSSGFGRRGNGRSP